jgi:hypothetical protein
MAAVKEKLGQMPCLCCGHPVMVRKTASGTLTGVCDGCDISVFAKVGTDAYRAFVAAIKALPGTVPKEQSQEPEPAAPAAPPTPVPAVVIKPRPAGVFDFLNQGAK